MNIKMLSTRRVSEDGFKIKVYEKNQQYVMADTAARSLIACGWAEPIEYLSSADIILPVPNQKADGKRVSTLMREDGEPTC